MNSKEYRRLLERCVADDVRRLYSIAAELSADWFYLRELYRGEESSPTGAGDGETRQESREDPTQQTLFEEELLPWDDPPTGAERLREVGPEAPEGLLRSRAEVREESPNLNEAKEL